MVVAMTAQPPFQSLEVSMIVSLLPQDLSNPMESIESQLHDQLMRYDEELGGVVLTYSNVAINPLDITGQINVDEPHVHVRVTATALVFGPRNGMVLQGKVSEACATHLSVLAYGVFNATLPCPKSNDSSSGSSIASAWEAADAGSVVRFRVLRMQHAEGLLSIEGHLEKVLSSGEGGDDSAATTPASPSSKQNKKRSLEAVASPTSPTSGGEGGSSQKDSKIDAEGSKKKKKKRDRSEDASGPPSSPTKSSSAAAPEGAGSKGSTEGDHETDASSSGKVVDDEEAKRLAKRGRKKAALAKKKAEQAAAK